MSDSERHAQNPATTVVSVRSATVKRGLPVYSIVALATLVICAAVLRLWSADLHVPLYYAFGGDGYSQAILAQNLAHHPSIYSYPELAAPIGGATYDTPSLSFTNYAIEYLLILLSGNPYVGLNLFFILLFPVTALTALYALRRFGLPHAAAVPMAILYSFLPGRFFRNESHLEYAAYWLVPLAILGAVLIARGEPFWTRSDGRIRPTRDGIFLAIVFFLLGSDNPYHAFFAGVFLLTAAAIGRVRTRSWAPVVATVVLLGLTFTSAFLTAIPTFVYRHDHGQNQRAFERTPEESQYYGLQLAQLLLPVQGHRLPAFRDARAYFDSRSPLDNENAWSSLGAAGTIGFCVLIGALVARTGRKISPDLETLALFLLFGVLLATVGGFGALFNYYVATAIRAYNRISSYLGFFTLAAFGFVLAAAWRRFGTTPGRRSIVAAALGALIVLGILDQVPRQMRPPVQDNERMFTDDAAFVASIQTALDPHAAVYELPWFRYPEAAPKLGLSPFAEARPFIHSAQLRWSYGAMDGRVPADWEKNTSILPPREMIEQLILAGYSGIYIFRAGYPDRAQALETELHRLLNEDPLVDGSQEMSFFSLRDLARAAHRADPRIGTTAFSRQAVTTIDTHFGPGFSTEESTASQRWMWASRTAQLVLSDHGDSRIAHVRGLIETPGGRGEMIVSGSTFTRRFATGPAAVPIDLSVTLARGMTTLTFTSTAPRLVAPGDPRELVFRLVNVTIAGSAVHSAALERLVDALGSQPRTGSDAARNRALGKIANGCWPLEHADQATWNWCGRQGSIRVTPRKSGIIHVRALVATPGSARSEIRFSAEGRTSTYVTSPSGTHIDVTLKGQALRPVSITFSTNAARLSAPADPRSLFIKLMNLSISASS